MSCWNMCHKCLKDMEDCECFASRAKKKIYITMIDGMIESIVVSKDLKGTEFIIIDDRCSHDYDDAELCNGEKVYVTCTTANEILRTHQFKFKKIRNKK